MDFSDYGGGPIEAWLQAKGFHLEHGAEDPEVLSSHDGALVVEAKAPVKGFLVHQAVPRQQVSTVRFTGASSNICTVRRMSKTCRMKP